MKRVILIIVPLMLLLTSCSAPFGSTMGNSFLKTNQENESLKRILNSLQSKDKESIKSMFAPNAIAEARDFDEQINALFDFYCGDIKSWVEKGSSEFVTQEKGKIKKEVYKWYQVDTEYQSYLFIMIECPVDSEQPDNIGIHTLRVIYTANQETQFTSWDDISIPGIYTPGTRGDKGTVCVNPRTKGRFCCPYVP